MKKLLASLISNKALFILVALLSCAAWYISYSAGLVLVYNDAMSHLNQSRLVIDNQQTGLAQLGSVWLPLSHILSLPLVWNDWAWKSGLAGSFVSMASYVATVAGVFAIIRQLTNNKLAAVIAGCVTALNANLLYLQTTPLTEPLFVALFTASVLFLIKYLQASDVKYLLPTAFFVCAQMMTRYDGWFVAAVMAAVIVLFEFRIKRQRLAQAVGNLALFAVPVAFTALLWLGYNALIFGSPLYFATGEFSAKTQQNLIEANSGLIAKGDMLMSAKVFIYNISANIGWGVLAMAAIGWSAFLLAAGKKFVLQKLSVFGLFASLIAFNILALFFGFSIISLPGLSGADSGPSALFNVRYGILLLPFAAIGVGLLAAVKNKFLITAAAVLVICAQTSLMYTTEPISLRDGRSGSSAFVHDDLAMALGKRVSGDETVLMSMYSYNPMAFKSSLDLKSFLHEGVSERWDEANVNPEKFADWIVMSNGDETDHVYKMLVIEHGGAFLKNYQLDYSDNHGMIYRRVMPEAAIGAL